MSAATHDDECCPGRAAWQSFLEGALDASEEARLDAHLEGCELCVALLEQLSGSWSIQGRVSGSRSVASSVATTQITDFTRRLAACPPPEGGSGRGGEAMIPLAMPRIPGVEDLVPVARGGMGVIYRGRDMALGRTVAVKVLGAGGLLSESAKARAKRESLLCARIEHPNVVTVHAAGEAEGMPYLVMSWIVGPSLQKRIDDEGPLPAREAAGIAHDLARGLERVHAYGIVHRNLKPDNVLLSTKSEPPTPILIDFGLARAEEAEQQLTQVMSVMGTPGYMAPEQTGLDPTLGGVGPATDVHVLGGVLYCMLTGKPPYAAATATAAMQRAAQGELSEPSALGRQVSHDLRTIVQKCLQTLPSRRYRSAGELADELQRFLEGRPVFARPVGVLERIGKWARRRPLAAAVSGLAAMLCVLAAVGTAYHVAELGRANRIIAASRDRADEAMALAGRSMDRLTGAAIQQMLLRGEAFNASDQGFLDQLVDEFSRWPLGSNPADGLRFRAAGFERLANLYSSMGRYQEACDCQQRELATLDELDAAQPGSSEVLGLRLNAMYRQRYSLYQLGRAEEAIQSSRVSIAMLEAAPDGFPRRESDLVDMKHHLGAFLHEQGKFKEGEPLLEESLVALRRLRERHPDDVDLAVQEINSLYNTQLCDYQAGRAEKRRQRSEQMIEAAESALLTFGERRPTFTRMLSDALGLSVGLLMDDRRLEDAVKQAERRRQLWQDAVAADGFARGDQVLRHAVDALLQLATLYRRLGRHSEAVNVLDEAIDLGQEIVDALPAVFDPAMSFGRVLYERAAIEESNGEPAVAIALFERAIGNLEPWLARESRSREAESLVTSAKQRAAALRRATPTSAQSVAESMAIE